MEKSLFQISLDNNMLSQYDKKYLVHKKCMVYALKLP
jgi:hypothetical protein